MSVEVRSFRWTKDERDALAILLRGGHDALTQLVQTPDEQSLTQLCEAQNVLFDWIKEHTDALTAELFWRAPLHLGLPSGGALQGKFIDAFQLMNSRLRWITERCDG